LDRAAWTESIWLRIGTGEYISRDCREGERDDCTDNSYFLNNYKLPNIPLVPVLGSIRRNAICCINCRWVFKCMAHPEISDIEVKEIGFW
jgi:hypothetical protein